MTPLALIVAGPTAGRKSALALELAERFRGTVINADAMQVYRELRVLTARPTKKTKPASRTHFTAYGPRLNRAVSRRGAGRRWSKCAGRATQVGCRS